MSLKRNTAWNLVGNGLPFLVGVITIPYLINHIGVEAFGILTLIWGLIGYFSLFDFGLGRALTQQVAARLVSDDKSNIPHLVKSGLMFTFFTGLLGGAVLIVLARPLAFHWLKIDLALQDETLQCLMISALGIPLTTVATGLRGVLEAYEDFKAVNFIRMGMGVASFGLPALCVMWIGNSLVWVVVALVVTRVVVLIAHVVLVNIKLIEKWWASKSSSSDIRSLMSFGAWMTLTNIIGPLMVTSDRFVISATLGASVVAYYTVPFEALIRILIIPTAVSVTLFPRLASHFVADVQKAKELYFRSIRVVALVLAPICFIIAVGSNWGLTLWLGKEFASKSWLIVSILSIGLFFNGLAYIPFATIQANGQAKKTAILHIAELFIYVPLLFLFLNYFGIVGAAIVWVIRVAIDLLCLMIIAKKEFAMSGGEISREPHPSNL
jgi:O-antigen/teichoic acid export membrane protein